MLKITCGKHSVSFPPRAKKTDIQLRLLDHVCNSGCTGHLYLFKSLDHERHPKSLKTGNKYVTHLSIDNAVSRRKQAREFLSAKRSSARPVAQSVRLNAAPPVHLLDGESQFPFFASDDLKAKIIQQWQEEMKVEKWMPTVCAVCGQRRTPSEITVVPPEQVDFTLLRNDFLPSEVKPRSYNLQAYEEAILYHKGLHDLHVKGDIDVCQSCYGSLVVRAQQPVDALANFQHYGHERLPEDVKLAFENASLFELMLVSRCRVSRITHLFVCNPGSALFGGNPATSQRYSRGNVAIIPQNSNKVRDVLPPSSSEIAQSVCVLFVGGATQPSRENIARLNPVLVSKDRVSTLIHFLLENNTLYRECGTTFSQENLDSLFRAPTASETDSNGSSGLLDAVEVSHLPQTSASDGSSAVSSDYTDRN